MGHDGGVPVDRDNAPDRAAPRVRGVDTERTPTAGAGRTPTADTERTPTVGAGRTPTDPAGVDADRPPAVVLGVGASRGCPPTELRALADATLAEAGLSPDAVVAVASADVKADEPAVLALAAGLGVPARFLPASALAAVAVPTPSAIVASHVGTPSVAEAAALLVARQLGAPATVRPDRPAAPAPGATAPVRDDAVRLLVPKRRSAHATCAIAPAARRPVPTEVPLP